MKTNVPPESLRPCFECEAEEVRTVREPFAAYGTEATVPGVPPERCAKYGDCTVPASFAGLIDAWIDRTAECPPRKDLQAFLAQYGLTRKEEITTCEPDR